MDSESSEPFLIHLRASQVAVVYAMIESNTEKVDLPESELPPSVREKEDAMRRLEAWAHSDGAYDFLTKLVPAAQAALKRTGYA